MHLGTWYLAGSSITPSAAQAGSLNPIGARELHVGMAARKSPPALIVDLTGADSHLVNFDTLFRAVVRAKNSDGQAVLVAGEGPVTCFLRAVGMEGFVPIVGSLAAAWALLEARAATTTGHWWRTDERTGPEVAGEFGPTGGMVTGSGGDATAPSTTRPYGPIAA